MKWAREIPAFTEQYTKARKDLLEYWAEEILDIADDGSNDWIKREKEEGRIETVVDSEHINRSRLRVDTRKWLLSKLDAKKYGDKLAVGGADDLPAIQVTKVERSIVRSNPDNSNG
jgi:hypothetical protein